MNLSDLLRLKLKHDDYITLIEQGCSSFDAEENRLLCNILVGCEFNVLEEQALVQSVLAQTRFDPDAGHLAEDEGDHVALCPHCLTPPLPPLYDYWQWRQKGGSE